MPEEMRNMDRDAVVELAREFAANEVAPISVDADREEKTPVELVHRMGELGLLGGVIPEQDGGAGLDFRTYIDMVLEVAAVDQTIAGFMTFPSGLVGGSILQFGTPEQKKRWLDPLARGQIFGAAGVTEPRSGSDVAGMTTTYRADGDEFILNGSKAWISNGGIASFLLTFATRDRDLAHKGITAFIIPTDTPGLTYHPYRNKLGFRALATGDFALDDVRVPASAVLGEEGEGFRVAMSAVERGRLGVSTRATGITLACLRECVGYAQEREVFDHPISEFQLVQSKITDMVLGARTSRSLLYESGDALQQGNRARQLTCMTKLHCTDVAQRSASDAILVHGAYGTAEEYAVSRHYRDAKVLQIVEGSNDLHRALVAEIELGLRGKGE